MNKIQIKNYSTGVVIYEHEEENNTIRKTVEAAVRAGANLRSAYLAGAYLAGANLGGAYLRSADLGGADLSGADLSDAYLRSANLRSANLRSANLGGAKKIPFVPLACPSDGAFTGWKKVEADGVSYIVKLYIPEDARRSSATTNKCRCDKAKVISITRIADGEEVKKITNRDYTVTTYEVGCIVTPDSFDENRWNECSHGIHFFINKQEAINY